MPEAALLNQLDRAISTHGAEDDSLVTGQSRHQAWQEIIDRKLIEWGRRPEEFEDDGITPPTADVVHSACEIAKAMGEKGFPAPHRVVLTPSGGIAFERSNGPCHEEIIIRPGHGAEILTFKNSRLQSRRRIE
jgi:hypothetical protein